MTEKPLTQKEKIRAALLDRLITDDPEIIHQISRETEDLVVLRAIAKHPSAAPLTLKLLSVRNNRSVRTKIAQNQNTPYESLVMLQDLGYDVPQSVMNHAAVVELNLRKGIEFDDALPGIYAQRILRTL